MSTLNVGIGLDRAYRDNQGLGSGQGIGALAPFTALGTSAEGPAQMINILINNAKGEQEDTSTNINIQGEQDNQDKEDDKEKPNLLADLTEVAHEGLSLVGGVLKLGTSICGLCTKLCSII